MGGERRWDQIDQVAEIFDKAVHQAILLQKTAQQNHEQSARATAIFQEVVDKLPREVVAAVTRNLDAAAKSAAGTMVQQWTEANAAAEAATAAYKKAESELSWKMVVYISSGVIATGVVLAALLTYFRPAEQELQALREERRVLVADIEKLRRMGAGLDVSFCEVGGRNKPCVRVDLQSPNYEGGYKLLPSR